MDKETINKEFIQSIKTKLLQEKKRLEKELGGIAEKDKHQKDSYRVRYPEQVSTRDGENVQEVVTFNDTISLEGVLETLLKAVNEALIKIQKNTYGLCEKCKTPIDPRRLKAFPAATLCINCKNQFKEST